MRKKSHISVVEGEHADQDQMHDETLGEMPEPQDGSGEMDAEPLEFYDDDVVADSHRGWIVPAIAAVSIAVWTAFHFWAVRGSLFSSSTPAAWAEAIIGWSGPVILIVALWILATRNSTHEAKRFAVISRSLAEESANLETRLSATNRELSLAREFLGSQHAERLQSLVRDNGAQVDAIASVSSAALENMNRLRDNLPVIANSARDVSNQIGGVGRNAQEQLDRLNEGFDRLEAFGKASEEQISLLRDRIDDTIAEFRLEADKFAEISDLRFSALRRGGEEFRSELDAREVDALAQMRLRWDALRAELDEARSQSEVAEQLALASLGGRIATLRKDFGEAADEMRKGEEEALGVWDKQAAALQSRLRQAVEEIITVDRRAMENANAALAKLQQDAITFDEATAERGRHFEAESLGRMERLKAGQDELSALLDERMAAIDASISERHEVQRAQIASIDQQGADLVERMAQAGSTFDTIAGQGREANETLSAGIGELNRVLVDSRESLDGTDMAVAALTDASVRLLELIQASERHSREDLPHAMETSENRLADVERRAGEIHALLEQARGSGDSIGERMGSIEDRTREVLAGFGGFHSEFEDRNSAQLEAVERLRAEVAALGEESEAVAARVQSELKAAIDALDSSAREALGTFETDRAEQINALAGQVGERSAQAIEAALAEHTDSALASLDEAREKSVAAARASMQQMRDQLVRVNELTSNLESRIAHARERAEQNVDADFARRVSLILRGDRGIFTRRAVRLVDNTEAREIAEIYDNDPDLRQHVNRYIHDFESMLRTVLATRDGHAVSVTLLSSDMGKLYVVLAQALERLRT
ncbi:MAG: hypothetical protein DI637_11175 [Citromicrobium sp.]|nr:MAG: hypothetical protein DI637_11175 [Citromicrobium sp.]